MFEIGQQVTVITVKGIAYEGVIRARAIADDGQGAYKIAVIGCGPGQPGQWHKAGDVFVQEIFACDAEQAEEALSDHTRADNPADAW